MDEQPDYRDCSNCLKNNIGCGNTEGWRPIFWFDHPELDWYWVKESAEICVDLARKHDNYKFICTSNFTHQQFKGIWEDVNWHKQILNTCTPLIILLSTNVS